MNTNQAPGPNFKGTRGTQILDERGVFVRIIDPNSPIEMAVAWDAYQASQAAWDVPGDTLSWWQFVELDAIHVALMDADAGLLDCCFGVGLAHGFAQFANAPTVETWWTDFVYFAAAPGAKRGVMNRCGETVVEVCHDIARRWAAQHGVKPMMRLIGRPAWGRILKRLSIERSASGWIGDNQVRSHNGI